MLAAGVIIIAATLAFASGLEISFSSITSVHNKFHFLILGYKINNKGIPNIIEGIELFISLAGQKSSPKTGGKVLAGLVYENIT